MRQLHTVLRTLGESPFGSPLLLGLVVLGLFRSPWSRRRCLHESFLLVMAMACFVPLLTVQFFWYRLILPFFPLLLVWASKGLGEADEWARRSWSTITGREDGGRGVARAGRMVQLGLMLVLLALSAYGVLTDVPEVQESSAGGAVAEKVAGLWIDANRPGPKRVMEEGTIVPYYARGEWAPTPYADGAIALRYVLQRSKPDFLVLVGHKRTRLPYMTDWLTRGLPGDRFELIYESGSTLDDAIKIYELHLPS